MKRKKDDQMVLTAIRLPQSLRDRLDNVASERGLGEEIRRRLEASFEAEKAAASPKTQELLAAIASFAKETARDYGDWWEDAFAFEALKASVNLLLTHYQPKGEPVPHPNPDGAGDLLYGPDHSIEIISRTVVSGWIRDRARHADGEKRK